MFIKSCRECQYRSIIRLKSMVIIANFVIGTCECLQSPKLFGEYHHMGTLGILTCEILELEFAYLLNPDKDISRITVLENSRSARILEALESTGSVIPNRIPALESFAPDPENRMEVLVNVLELGLHNRKQLLQEGLVEAACEMGSRVDALLLGYGLCGNALQNPDELLSDAGVPIFIPNETKLK